MKRILIGLLLVITTCSCTHTLRDRGVVSGVEKCNFKIKNYPDDTAKYIITVERMDYHSLLCKVKIKTNTYYNVGDTITFIKK